MAEKTCDDCRHDDIPAFQYPCCACWGHNQWEAWETEENPYWERITALAERQRAKGMSKYGQGLEMNPADILERINHLQEELIDALMYCEWIKERIAND